VSVQGLGRAGRIAAVGGHELIRRARRWRKMLGGGMRQAGLLAAAGLYALEHNIERLAEDHANAAALAAGLSAIDEIEVDINAVQTNMVFIRPRDAGGLVDALARQDIFLLHGREQIRLVTHLDVDAAGVSRCVAAAKAFYAHA